MAAEEKIEDTGLGLAEFLSDDSGVPSEAESTDSAAEPETTETPAEEPEPESAEEKVEAGEEPEPARAEPEAAPEKATKPSPWESDENPYKIQAQTFAERVKETRDWTTQLRQQNVELQRRLEILGKKIDGTYDEAADAAAQPSPDELTRQAELGGKVRSSVAVAEQMYGREKVQELLFAENAPFRAYDNDAAVQARVLGSEAPALEAIRFLQEQAFFRKYGRDPQAIVEKIRTEQQEELTKRITKEVTKQVQERLKQRAGQVAGLSEARGSETERKQTEPVVTPLDQIGNPALA